MDADLDSYSLVLGAGGRPGLAFHAGTLLALELHGLRPGDAATITGTSAGSIATALFSIGAEVEDLAAYTTGVAPRDEFRDVDAVIRAADRLGLSVDAGALVALADVRRALAAVTHLRARRLPAALATLLPGLVKISHRFAFLDAAPALTDGPAWRIVAADQGARRHVLSAGDAPLSVAVAASCAVPGLFAPVPHGGRRLVDGGVHSTTNADLAADDPGRTVIVLAPMATRPNGGQEQPRTLADVTLAREVRRLREAGKHVVTFRPSARLRRVMGWNPLATRHTRAIVAAALIEAVDVVGELGPRRRPAAAIAA